MRKMIGLLAILTLSIWATTARAELPFKVLAQDTTIVKDIRAEGQDVWIKLTPEHTGDEVTVRISDQNRNHYRPWFDGNLDLVSTGFRGNDVWSDRVQTTARYIEYWVDGNLVLHLERIK